MNATWRDGLRRRSTTRVRKSRSRGCPRASAAQPGRTGESTLLQRTHSAIAKEDRSADFRFTPRTTVPETTAGAASEALAALMP